MRVYILHKGTTDTPRVTRCLGSHIEVLGSCTVHASGMLSPDIVEADAVIFDVLQGTGAEDDLDYIKRVRAMTAVPILLVTNEREVPEYHERMFDHGVDGCIHAPFSKDELRLRLEILIRKSSTTLFSNTTVAVGEVTMDIQTHRVEQGGRRLDFTRAEYAILFHLFLHKNAVARREDLSRCLPGELHTDSHAVNVHILNIRHKIGDTELIRTIPHYGFTVSDVPLSV